MLRGPAAAEEPFPLLPDGAWPPGAPRVARVLALKDLVLTFPLRLCAGHSNSGDSPFTELSPLSRFPSRWGLCRKPRTPHGQGWVHGNMAVPCIWNSRRAAPMPGTDSAPQWRLGALASGLSSGTEPFRAMMSHKALGPWGTPAGRGPVGPTPRQGDAHGHFTRQKLLPG